MSDTQLKQELNKFGAEPLLAVEKKLILGSLTLGVVLLAILGLLARI